MEQKQLAVFGAGLKGREAAKYYKSQGYEVKCFIDNAKEKQGTVVDGLSVYSFEDYRRMFDCDIHIAGGMLFKKEIEAQILDAGIKKYCFYDDQLYLEKERLFTCCTPQEMEDVILYHLLKEHESIFYIDVGSNDPTSASVTKLIYDRLNAHGINIEPQPSLIAQTNRERRRDINLCLGMGKCPGGGKLIIQGGLTTSCDENRFTKKSTQIDIKIETLKNICMKYVPENITITFLKIDVEGKEKDVLLGADFNKYRPEIVIIESTKPNTLIPVYSEWEYILTENRYIFGFMKGVNRYYFAKEKYDDYKNKLPDIDCLDRYYVIEGIKRYFIC